jgi:putative ABC transport system substrate-binding protein
MADRRPLALALLAAACSWLPLPAAAQPAPGNHRVAFINVGPAAPNAANVAGFRAGMAELGYVEGRNLAIDFRWAEGRAEELPRLLSEAFAARPGVVVSTGGPPTARAVKNSGTSLPVVFITGNPVAEGLVRDLARPGANFTGFALLAGDLEAKRLEMLRQLLPAAKRVAVIWNPAAPAIDGIIRGVEQAGERLGFTLLMFKARNKAELDAAFREIPAARTDALFVVADPVLGFERAAIVEFANRQRMPGIYFWREFAEAGGLASYGTNLAAVYRRAAAYVDRILKGAQPGDLPVEQPTTFELALNLKTARALGIAIPEAVRLRADSVIE